MFGTAIIVFLTKTILYLLWSLELQLHGTLSAHRNLARDGSSRFSQNNRWGLFPSAALAWTVSDEAFMAGTKNVLSKLKLRLGYGVTGQQEIGDYQYLTTYSFSTNPNTTYLGTTLLKPNGYSPDLKWEQTATYNSPSTMVS